MDNQVPIGFAGLEALVSDVAQDVAAASGAAAIPAPSGTRGPPEHATTRASSPARGLAAIARAIPVQLWFIGGVFALVWVCSNLGRRTSPPPRRSVPVVANEYRSPPPTPATPARKANEAPTPSGLYSYVDSDGVRHFSSAPQRTSTSGESNDGEAGEPPVHLSGPVRAAAEKYKLPEALLLAVMKVESNFDAKRTGPNGRVGLMQLPPGIAKEMYVADPRNPVQNIEGGARYLRILANEYDGDLVRTLAAYRSGRDAVAKAGDQVPESAGTKEYVRRVIAAYQTYKRSPPWGASSTPVSTPAVARAAAEPTPERGGIQTKPPVGTGRALSTDEVRYCVFESERIDYMKPLVTDNARVETFNRYVQDYNSRCADFRYRRGTLEAIRREAAERGSDLETEARLRF